MSVTGDREGEPMKVGIALADVMAGKDATIAVLSALHARTTSPSRPASERRLWISLLHSATAALVNVAQNTLVSHAEAGRWGNAHPNLVPYQLFQAADRGMVLAVGNDAQWKAACGVLGLSALAADPSLETNAGRLAHRARVVAALSSRIGERPAHEWLGALTSAGVPCGVVKQVSEALRAVDASAITGIAPSIPGAVRRPPPLLDEHGDVIRRLGWGAFNT
jgi:glutaryl-CoA transferase